MKVASIYKRSEKGYIIFGSSKTVSGFNVASEPFISIQECEVNADTIANAIKASLRSDGKIMPDPKNWNEFNKSFLRNIGLKSLKELDNPQTKLVSISDDKGKMTFCPMRPAEKPDKGFINKSESDLIMIPNTASNQEITTAYELALSKCG